MRGRKRHSVATMSGLFLDVSWRCRQRAARARKHHVTDWRKMRTIECSAGESLDENVPAGIVLQLTWLLLVGSPEAGFYFWTLLQYLRVIYFDRAAICFFWIVSWEESRVSPSDDQVPTYRYFCNLHLDYTYLVLSKSLGKAIELESFTRKALKVNYFCSYWAKCHETRLLCHVVILTNAQTACLSSVMICQSEYSWEVE